MAELALDQETIAAAYARIDDDLQDALETLRRGSGPFMKAAAAVDYRDDAGVRLGMRHGPVDAAGLYVPGGKAASASVLMNAMPATVAGVGRRVMVVPAPDGELSDPVLAAAHIAGISECWTIGGAQAVAALAWGTESIRPVDKIVGPGNAYVATAKRQVFGRVGIDYCRAFEILILADRGNSPDWLAIDLLSQAEHDEAAQAILITDDAATANAVMDAVEAILPGLERSDVATLMA